MFLSPILGLCMQSIDIALELSPVDPPNPSATDLHRRQFTGSNECVDLRNAYRQIGGDVFKGQQARFHAGRGLWRSPTPLRTVAWRHGRTIAPDRALGPDLVPFALVCGRARATA